MLCLVWRTASSYPFHNSVDGLVCHQKNWWQADQRWKETILLSAQVKSASWWYWWYCTVAMCAAADELNWVPKICSEASRLHSVVFPSKDKKVNLFRVTVSTNRDLSLSLFSTTILKLLLMLRKRCAVSVGRLRSFTAIKQLTGVEASAFTSQSAHSTHHIACALAGLDSPCWVLDRQNHLSDRAECCRTTWIEQTPSIHPFKCPLRKSCEVQYWPEHPGPKNNDLGCKW